MTNVIYPLEEPDLVTNWAQLASSSSGMRGGICSANYLNTASGKRMVIDMFEYHCDISRNVSWRPSTARMRMESSHFDAL
jgi:hypothetical protein